MYAGDQVIVKGRRIGDPDRSGEVLEARGTLAHGPLLVRWDDGHVTLLFPGTNAIVEHRRHDDSRIPELVG